MIYDEVIGVNFYPLKSAHAATVDGQPPTELGVGEAGFEEYGVRDRDWVLFDVSDGCFVSQRGWNGSGRLAHKADTQLATVQVDVRPDHVSFTSAIGTLELDNAPQIGKPLDIDMFGKRLPVLTQSAEACNYFGRLLGREVLLTRTDRDDQRVIPEKYRREGAFNNVAGSDGYSFLMLSQSSLTTAHTRQAMQPNSVPISRYRGNIIISGQQLGPFQEDYIDGSVSFQIGDIRTWVVKACMRCPIPNIDQETGERSGGGLKVLRGRAGRISNGDEGVFFGQNLLHGSVGKIVIGDQIQISALANKPNIVFRDPQ